MSVIGLHLVRCCLARRTMGRERVERLRGPTLGCKDRDRPIDAAGSQEFRSVIPDRSDLLAPQVDILPF